MVAVPVRTEVLDVVKVESGSHEATAVKLRPIDQGFLKILPLNNWLNTIDKKVELNAPRA